MDKRRPARTKQALRARIWSLLERREVGRFPLPLAHRIPNFAGAAPYWVRLVRSGTTVTAYKSANGTAWTQVGSLSASFPADCYVGLVVASGSNTTLNTSQFSNVSVSP